MPLSEKRDQADRQDCGLTYLTPAAVHYDRAATVLAVRHRTRLAAYAAHPEGVGARMRAGLRASNRRARHLPMRYETGLPSSVIRFRT